jgi:hypothetical protein
VGRVLRASAATYWTRADAGDRRRYLLAAALLASGLVHLGVQALLGGPWSGPVSWRKPITFGLSFGLTLATLTWVTTHLPIPAARRAILLNASAAACALEVAVITTQAWRHVPSHFNVTTPLNAALAYAAAAGGAVILTCTLGIAAAIPRSDPRTPPSMALAVRFGLLTFLVALAVGVAMIVLGVRETRLVSQSAAYSVDEHLKAGHASMMHGILVLPALAWLASFTRWPESRRVRVVALGCLGYLLPATAVLTDAVLGEDPFHAITTSGITAVLDVAGVVALLFAVTSVGVELVRRGARPGLDHPSRASEGRHRSAESVREPRRTG